MSKKHPKKPDPPTESPAPEAAASPEGPAAEGPAPSVPAVAEALLEERVRELERELEAALAEAKAASDRGLRTLAEFDNYRRRTEREREESHRRGRAEVLRELLEVADNFDRALGQDHGDVPGPFLEGMRLVARGLHDVLDRKGVARIDAEGRPFDPEVHEALAVVAAPDAPPNTVVQVVQAGYRLEDRVLRPAKVIVSAAVPAGVDATGGAGDAVGDAAGPSSAADVPEAS